jgi:putative NADH-flavin reductase
MNLTVFGATGRLGRHVLEQGLRRGHKLTAFTRRPQALADPAALAAVVAGDGRDRQAVRRAIDGADGVIAIVASATRKGPHHTTEVARVITQAMADLGVRRLVVTDPYPIVADRPRLLIWLLRRFLAAAYADALAMERIVTTTDLDWTIVRLNRLLDGPPRGTAHVSRDLLARPSSITRADAAAVLLDVVADPALARVALNVSGR